MRRPMTDGKDGFSDPLQHLMKITGSNEWGAAIMNSAKHLMIATDAQGTVIFFNQASESALGFSAAEIVGKQSPALWHDEAEVASRASELSAELGSAIQPGFKVFTEVPLRDGSETREWTFIRKDKKRFAGMLTVTCIKDSESNTSGYLGVIEDLTESRGAQDKVAEMRDFLDLINANNPDLIFVKDKDYKIVEANPAFLSVYPEDQQDQIIGYTTVEKYNAEEAAAFLKMDKIAFEQGYSETVEKIAFPDGQIRILNTKKIRFENPKGDPFILGIGRDVTEQQRLIDELRSTNEELEEFAYRTSHDLRSPLVSSISLLGLVRTSMSEGDLKLASQSLSHVENSLQALETLVKDILSLSQTKNADEDEQEVNVEALIDESIANLSHMQHFERLRIQKNIEISEPIVLKRSRLALIVENLISNSIKYQDPAKASSFLKIDVKIEAKRLILSIEDNGLGIPEHHHSQLFKMFKRFHTKVSFGSGLGLYMMKKSAMILGGTLEFEDPGEGAKFKLCVPFKSDASGYRAAS